MMSELPVVAIVGPTASGKTAVSIEVARRCGGEIISMDSRQVYRGMNVGTAKATPEQQALIAHHGLDLLDPGERFSAGRYAAFAREAIADIRSRRRLPILVGGTGFFLRSLTHPIFEEPPLDPDRRARLQAHLQHMETGDLHRWLAALDPPAADRLRNWGGRQRLMRALEIPLLTGRPLTWWHRTAPAPEPPLEPLVFLLDVPADELDRRIRERVDRMVALGLVEELASLLHRGFDEFSPGLDATGYIELIPYLRGERSLEDALEQVVQNTRSYARRQRTWFRRQLPAGAVRIDATQSPELAADQVSAIVELEGRGQGRTYTQRSTR